MQPSRSWWRGWVYPGLGLLVGCLGVVQQLADPGVTHLPVALCACAVAGAAVVLLPRRPPAGFGGLAGLAGLAALLVIDAGYQLIAGDSPFATFLATMIAMYHLARTGTRRMMALGYPATLATLVVMDVVVSGRGQDSPANVIIPVVYFGAAAGLGALVRHTATFARVARERSEALEREQVHLAGLVAAAERTRIARELHDVISHTVSLMVLHAEAAREVLTAQPAQAAATLDTIGDTGRRAISDLRILLGVLRDDDDNRAPALDLGALIEPVRRTGLNVDIVETGDGGPIPASLRPTTYRVIQEALTNVLKHATASNVVVTITHGPAALTVEIVDDGCAASPAALAPSVGGSGRGLAGMAERVRAHGGTLETGRLAPHGFRVLARLPGAAA